MPILGKPKVYVAGSYSGGDVMNNIYNAIELGDRLLWYGYIPFIPHLTGFWHMMFPHSYEKWMDYDAEWLKSCDAVIRILGVSKGADREVEMAKKLGIPVFTDTSDLNKYFMEKSNAN